MSLPLADAGPLEGLLTGGLSECLKSQAVADKVIAVVSTETRLPPLIVRLAYFWLLVPAVRHIQEGVGDNAVHRVTDTFVGFLGTRLTGVLLPKLAEQMARESANNAVNQELLKRHPTLPNASLLSPEALTQAILALQEDKDEAFQRDIKSQLLLLQHVAERQPVLDLVVAPPPGNEDPNRFDFVARKTALVGRRVALTELEEFAGGNEPFRWWAVGGEAGVGKSRLALEAMLKLEPTWRAGFLPRSLGGSFSWHDWRPLYPTFIAVDDAGIRIPDVASMVQAINMAAKDGKLDWPVRLLLLDRAADLLQLPRWQDIQTAHVRPTQFRQAMMLCGLEEEEVLAVASDVAGPENAQAALQVLQRIEGESRPLFVSLAADALRTGIQQGFGSVLGLTRDFWQRTFETFWGPLGAGDIERDILCLATLISGMPLHTLADRAWSDLGIQKANREVRERLSRMHVLDGSSRIRSLQPSFAGEVFVLDHLQQAIELGEDPSRSLLRAAWRHSPFQIAGFIQRAVSDLPDHPAIQWILGGGPEPGDTSAREAWSACLRASVGSCLAVGNTEFALQIWEQLLRVADESPTDEVLADAAYTAADIISHFGLQKIRRAIRVLQSLIETFYKARSAVAPIVAMPPVTSDRLQMLEISRKVAPIIDAYIGIGATWPGALGSACQATFLLLGALPSRKARILLLDVLEKTIQPFINATMNASGNDPGVLLLRSLHQLITGTRHIDENALILSEGRVRIHQVQSLEALEQGDVETCTAEASAAVELAMLEELPDDVQDEIGVWMISMVIALNRAGYLAEAHFLLAFGLGGEEAIGSRDSIVASLGEGAELELADQLYLVAIQRPIP